MAQETLQLSELPKTCKFYLVLSCRILHPPYRKECVSNLLKKKTVILYEYVFLFCFNLMCGIRGCFIISPGADSLCLKFSGLLRGYKCKSSCCICVCYGWIKEQCSSYWSKVVDLCVSKGNDRPMLLQGEKQVHNSAHKVGCYFDIKTVQG